MLAKKKICEGCGKECYLWKGKLCKACSSKNNPKSLKKTQFKAKKSRIKKMSIKGLQKKEEKKEYTKKQFELFKEVYKDSLFKVCFECGCKVNGESSVNYHHCLYKGIPKYKKFALEMWNIVLICFDCHQKTHNNIDLTPKIRDYTETLKEIHG